MKKVLVTGASGFIGRQCVPILIAKGYEVHALSRLSPAPALAAAWHECDLLQPGRAAELIGRVRPESILHLAWYAVPGKFWEAQENLEWVRASRELLCAFADHGGRRFVAAGTCAEYASNAGECLENVTPLLPKTLYGTCKHEFQQILQSSAAQIGLSAAWGRIFFLYGPHENSSRLVAYVIRSLLRGDPALCSDGKQVLDFLHVQDVAAAFIALLESEAQGPVNIGSGKPTQLRTMLEEIGRQLGRLELIHFGARPASSGTSQLWANVGRLQREADWSPRYDLTRGITQTIEWWRGSIEIPTRD